VSATRLVADAATPYRAPSHRMPPVRLFVPASVWPALLFAFALSTVLALLAVGEHGVWLPVGIGFSVLVVAHGLVACRFIPWIPGLIGMVACLQWIVIPWLAYSVPPYYPQFGMVLLPPEYFSFAAPATIALVVGLCLPLLGAGRTAGRATAGEHERAATIRGTCEAMVWGGLVIRLVLLDAAPASLGFALLLLANLSFVGVFGLALIRAPGWLLRALAVYGVLVMQSSAEGMFHELLLWSAYLGAIVAFRSRLSFRRIAVVSTFAFIGILALNGIKEGYRQAISTRTDLTAVGRLLLLANVLGDLATDPDALLSPDNVSLNVTRLNQGWIIARVLWHVPASEPYARGETIVASAEATLLPRVLAPDKLVVGGHEYFSRFTGVPLMPGTSMDLSVAGEMYANFGRFGGILAVLGYGVLLGLLFRLFTRWARTSVLWWSWAPFVMLHTAKAEGSFAEPLNHIVKSFIVMLVVIAVLPGWVELRRFRFGRRARVPRPVAQPLGAAGHD
jgi:hypothetical protein